jgi:hypothetical protein
MKCVLGVCVGGGWLLLVLPQLTAQQPGAPSSASTGARNALASCS